MERCGEGARSAGSGNWRGGLGRATPGDREAKAQPARLPRIHRSIGPHHANRRRPPRETHPSGGGFLREGGDERRVVAHGRIAEDRGKIVVEGPRGLATRLLGTDDLELWRGGGSRRLDLDPRLSHGRAHPGESEESEGEANRDCQSPGRHTSSVPDTRGSGKLNPGPSELAGNPDLRSPRARRVLGDSAEG